MQIILPDDGRNASFYKPRPNQGRLAQPGFGWPSAAGGSTIAPYMGTKNKPLLLADASSEELEGIANFIAVTSSLDQDRSDAQMITKALSLRLLIVSMGIPERIQAIHRLLEYRRSDGEVMMDALDLYYRVISARRPRGRSRVVTFPASVFETHSEA